MRAGFSVSENSYSDNNCLAMSGWYSSQLFSQCCNVNVALLDCHGYFTADQTGLVGIY